MHERLLVEELQRKVAEGRFERALTYGELLLRSARDRVGVLEVMNAAVGGILRALEQADRAPEEAFARSASEYRALAARLAVDLAAARTGDGAG
jgi:hypothetical protein